MTFPRADKPKGCPYQLPENISYPCPNCHCGEAEDIAEKSRLKDSWSAADRYFGRAAFDALSDALAEMPKATLWCVGDMEDGPFARVVLPQPNGGYGGGYRAAYGDTPADALRAAIATEAGTAATVKQGAVHEGAGRRHRPDCVCKACTPEAAA